MMRSIVRRVVALLSHHPLLILGALVFLTVVVVWWIFSAPIAQWLRSVQSADVVTFLQEHLLAIGIIGGCLLIFALIWLPKWQASSVQNVKDRLTVENATRQTLAQIVGGGAVIAGLFFTWANLQMAQETATTSQKTAAKNLELTREGQITDQFTKALEQLGAADQAGKKKLEVRLAGIYALGQIAEESEKYHWPIIEVLTAYVRENAPWPPEPPKVAPPLKGNQLPPKNPSATPPSPPKLAADIQAVLTVLGRRTQTYKKGEEQQLNLINTDLRRADLRGAQLQGANLTGAQLEQANLAGAQLEQANLENAQLQQANLENAQLQQANLENAQLQEAHLEGAQLQGATLYRTELRGVHNLTVEQLSTVQTLYQAQLAPPLLEQIQPQYPQILEKPYEGYTQDSYRNYR
jgi:uncharacterized protein YjbI with pentapeptide repeats